MKIFDIISTIFAIGAAVFWFWSASIKTPESFRIHVAKADGFMGEPLGDNPLGGTYIGNAYSEDLQYLANGLKKQSKLSAIAATAAAIAALSQAASILCHHY